MGYPAFDELFSKGHFMWLLAAAGSAVFAGVTSILVFSGETTREALQESDIQPDFALKDVGEITAVLHALSGR